MSIQISLLDHQDFLEHLAKHKDPLEKLASLMDWNEFMPILNRLLKKEKRSNAGRPPFDYVLMLKILILQSLYGLSDAQTEFQIVDRFTFKRFLGIKADTEIPDEKTIWLFKEKLGAEGIKRIFRKFNSEMVKHGFSAKKGSIVDATFVDVPRQRNSHDENEMIKNGDEPEDWDDNKKRQKDTDARWMKKHNENHFGYKNHVCIDNKHKLIREYDITPASTHDSQVFSKMLRAFKKNSRRSVYADSAYRSAKHERLLKENKLKSEIHNKGNRSGKLSQKQEELNSKKSKVRVRVEHVFGRLKHMHADMIRCIGISRAWMAIGIANLTYNMTRIVSLGGLRPRVA